MRQEWTDARLDDLNRRVESGFARVDRELRDLRRETNARFDEMNARFDAMNARFDAMQRTILQVGGGMVATFAIGFASLIVTRL